MALARFRIGPTVSETVWDTFDSTAAVAFRMDVSIFELRVEADFSIFESRAVVELLIFESNIGAS